MKKWTLGGVGKTNPKRTQNEPNSNPNEPNSNPIQTQYKPNLLDFQMNVSYIITEDYENMSNCTLAENKPNLSGRTLWRSRFKLADAPMAGQSSATTKRIRTGILVKKEGQ